MIPEFLKIGYLVIGFLTYMLFCIGTFRVYSQKKEMTKVFVLIFIYLYYSTLMIWVLSLIFSGNLFIKFLAYSFIFLLLGGLYLKHYYDVYVKPGDNKLYGQLI